VSWVLYHILAAFRREFPDVAMELQHTRQYVSSSPDATREIARRLGRLVRPGDLLSLRGDLGAGKTTFVQGLAQGMEVTELVTSPSFTLVHEHTGRARLFHLDLYRLVPDELADIGIDEVIGAEAVVAVEWSERLPPSLSGEGLEVRLEYGEGETEREITLRANGARGRRLLEALAEVGDAAAGD
jgi:tRNA threonylcarbamoyladenosine biosynthesis protein TsaE